MSQPNLPGEENVAGTLRVPSPDPVAEIEAELRDHLATAADRLQQQGLSPDAAKLKAQDSFGDPAAISRRCYWIKQGDTLMFRYAVVALLSILCLALAVTTVGSWRSQTRMAEQMGALTEQLKALAAREDQPVAAAQPKPPEFAGRAYVGSPAKPAAHIQITVLDVKDGSKVRTIATDAEGNFHSGPLGGGDYALLAETGEKFSGERYSRKVQSAPIAVYPGLEVPRQSFNTQYQKSGVAIELSRPLPKLNVDERYVVDTRLLVKVYSPQDRNRLWIAENEPPPAWPVYTTLDLPPDRSAGDRITGRNEYRSGGGRDFYEILSNEDLQQIENLSFGSYLSRVPAGKVQVTAAVLVDVFPVGYERPQIPRMGPRSVDASNRDAHYAAMEWNSLWSSGTNSSPKPPVSLQSIGYSQESDLDNDHYFWFAKGLGNIWLAHLRGPAEEAKPLRPYLIYHGWLSFPNDSTIETKSGEVTRLRITLPDDLESRVRNLIDSTTEPDQFFSSTLGHDKFLQSRRASSAGSQVADDRPKVRGTPETSPFFREVKVTSVGREPMAENASGPNSAVP